MFVSRLCWYFLLKDVFTETTFEIRYQRCPVARQHGNWLSVRSGNGFRLEFRIADERAKPFPESKLERDCRRSVEIFRDVGDDENEVVTLQQSEKLGRSVTSKLDGTELEKSASNCDVPVTSSSAERVKPRPFQCE